MTTKKSASAKQAAADTGSEESVDKIRDIIFGPQMRDYERKFAQLEDRIMKEVKRLQDEMDKRLTALEQSIDRELDELVKRLDGEHGDRLAAEQDLSETLASHVEQLRAELAGVDEELKQQIDQQARALNKEIKTRQSATDKRLEQETGSLRESKVDRSALTELFNELAARIAGEKAAEGGGKA